MNVSDRLTLNNLCSLYSGGCECPCKVVENVDELTGCSTLFTHVPWGNYRVQIKRQLNTDEFSPPTEFQVKNWKEPKNPRRKRPRSEIYRQVATSKVFDAGKDRSFYEK